MSPGRIDRGGGSWARPFLTTLAGTVGVLAIAGGGMLGYLSDSLFDSAEFSRRAADSLDDRRVAAYVASQVTDQVLAKYRDLTPYRPLILAGTEAMLASAPFRAIAQRAIRKAHEAVLSRGVENAVVSLEDVGVLLRSALALRPDLMEKIPSSAGTVLATLEKSPTLIALWEFLRLGQQLGRWAMGVFFGGFVLLGVALWLAPDRQDGLLRAGVALTVISGALLLLVQFGGWIFVWRVPDPAAGQALAGLWDSFGGRLRTPAIGIGGIGLVLAAAATSTFERIRLHRWGRALARWVVAPPRNGATRIERALVLFALGSIAVWHPAFVARALVFVTGAVLVFVGLEEAFRHILPAQAPVGGRTSRIGSGRQSLRTAATVAAVLLAAAGGAFALFARPWEKAERTVITDACNGMPELCDRRLDQVVFACTHNAMSAADISTWMFPNQEKGIRRQLEDGIRAFMLDVHRGTPVGDRVRTEIDDEVEARRKYEKAVGVEGVEAAMRIRDRMVGGKPGDTGLYLAHAFCELGATPLVSAFEEMRDFLVEHPNEVVVVIVEDAGASPQELAAAFEASGLVELVYRGPAQVPWPTLHDMVLRNERVVVFAESGRAGVPWIHPAFEVLQETPYSFKDTTEFSNKPNRGGTSGSLLLLNHWIDTAPRPLPSNAEYVNAYPFLMKRIERFRRARGRVPNLVAVDFYRSGDVLEVVRELNERGGAAALRAARAKR